MGWGENMGLAQGSPALAGASPTEKACPILLNQYCIIIINVTKQRRLQIFFMSKYLSFPHYQGNFMFEYKCMSFT